MYLAPKLGLVPKFTKILVNTIQKAFFNVCLGIF